MEKSIEKIWKEYMSDNSFHMPEIKSFNDIKSIHLIEGFKRTYGINIIILAFTATFTLFAFILGGIPLTGLFMFLLFFSLAIIGKIEINKLDNLDNSKSSQEYIKSLDDWLKKLIFRFSIIYRIWIPLLFIGFSIGILKTKMFIPFIGESLLEKFTTSSSYTFMGFPFIVILVILLMAAILSYFSNQLFILEMKSVYGNLIKRLDLLLKEFEE